MQDNIQVEKPRLLFVEGQDEVHLFSKLINDLALSDDIQVEETGGRANLHATIKSFRAAPNAHQIASIGVVRDADNDPAAAFASVCSALRKADLPCPNAPLERASQGDIGVTVMILPGGPRLGMLEDLCLESIGDDPAMDCVAEYFSCLEGKECAPNSVALAKARVRAFLASRQMLEEALLEDIQLQARTRWPGADSASSLDKIGVFLASRYTPDLRLGTAAEKGYIPLTHQAFKGVRNFLSSL